MTRPAAPCRTGPPPDAGKRRGAPAHMLRHAGARPSNCADASVRGCASRRLRTRRSASLPVCSPGQVPRRAFARRGGAA